MHDDNLLCLCGRKFVVTTNSRHDRPVYPNLARGMVLTGIVDQLWVADTTSTGKGVCLLGRHSGCVPGGCHFTCLASLFSS